MKILMIGEGMEIGGCETHIYELTRALVRLGHEVVLLCAGGRYATALENEGVRVLYAPTNRRMPHSLLYTAFKIRKLLREHFDVVHTHTRGMSTLLHRLTKIAHTVTVHLDFPVNALTRRFGYFGDSTLAVSEDIRAYLGREYGVCESDILLTRNGVDTTYFAGCESGSDIVHLSRLDRDRSLCALLLCEVAPFVLKKDGTRKIHIFGDGNDMPRVKKSAKLANDALGREGVIIHGKTKDIRSSLALGDIFVGVSRALLEAMAAGRACIVCGNEGYGGILNEENFTQLARTNFCARDFEGATKKKLAIDLLYLLRHEEVRQKCASFGKECAERFYRVEEMAEDALRAYRLAIEKSRRDILLVGFYGAGNFGDEIAMHSLTSLFSASHIRIVTKNKQKIDQERDVYLSRACALFALQKARWVVFGGGTLFQNETSTRSLLYYSLLAQVAQFTGAQTMIFSGGIDPVHGKFAEWLLHRALPCFSTIALRTQGDIESGQVISPRSRYFFCPDMIFLYPEVIRHKSKRCILILKDGCDEEGAVALANRCTMAGLDVIIAVLFRSEDEEVSVKVAKQTHGRIYFARDDKSFFSLLSRSVFVISMRLHGAFASLISHSLCFLFSGSEKQRKLLEDVKMRAEMLGVSSVLFPFDSFDEITMQNILHAKKEAVGKTYGFGKINRFYRDALYNCIMLLQLQEQQRPWEPSSCLREQQHRQELLLPWTSHEHPQEPRAEVQ